MIKLGIFDFFGKKKKTLSLKDSYQLFGNWNNVFTSSNINAYDFRTVRASIHTLAEHTSKLNCEIFRDTDEGIVYDDFNKKLQKLLEEQPNPYMNGKDFLYKVRTLYELDNNAYIYVDKDIYGNSIALYPIPYSQIQLIESNGQLYFKFYLAEGYDTFIAHFDDVACLRQYYANDLFFGESSRKILQQPIDTLDSTNQAIVNASQTSGQIRGLLKTVKAQIDPNDSKRMRDQFVADYVNMQNSSGIASLDSTVDFHQLKTENSIVNATQMKELRDEIYRIFGVNDDIIMSKFDEQSWEAFYSSKIEPFALALSLELSNKIFTKREKGYGNMITFSSSKLEYASLSTKMRGTELIDRGVLTPNELRRALGLKRRKDGGDEFVIRKEYAHTANLDEVQGVSPPKPSENETVKGGE